MVGLLFCVSGLREVQARWDAAASSSTGKCEDDEDGGGIPPSSSRARTNSKYREGEAGGGIHHLVLGVNELAGGLPLRPPLRHPAHPHIWGRVQCGWHGRVRGPIRVPAGWRRCGRSYVRGGVCNSVFLVVYEVVVMRREGDDAKDLPNAIYPSPLRQPVFVSVARVSHWPFLAS